MSLLNHVKNFFRKIFNFIIDKLGEQKGLFISEEATHFRLPYPRKKKKKLLTD